MEDINCCASCSAHPHLEREMELGCHMYRYTCLICGRSGSTTPYQESSLKHWNTINQPKEKNEMDNFTDTLHRAKTGRLFADVKGKVGGNLSYQKDLMIQVKAGKTIMTTIKSSLKQIPDLPTWASAFLDTEYADMIIGAVLPFIAHAVTDNDKVNKLAQMLATVSSMAIAEKMGFIDDFIDRLISGVGDIPWSDVVKKSE